MSPLPKATKKKFASEVVVFNSKKSQATKNQSNPSLRAAKKELKSQAKTEKNDFLTLKQAKFDVFKYGIKGFSKQEQEDANMQLAIKLGAAVSSSLNQHVI